MLVRFDLRSVLDMAREHFNADTITARAARVVFYAAALYYGCGLLRWL